MEEFNSRFANHNKQQKNTVTGVVVFVAVIALVIMIDLLVSNVFNGNTSSNRNDKLEISNINMQVQELSQDPTTGKTYYDVHITGNARNIKKTDLSYVKVEFTLYDINGNNIGIVVSDSISNLLSGDTWHFDATLGLFDSLYNTLTVKPYSCKLSNVDAGYKY